MCEKRERVDPQISFVVLYSSGTAKQLDILKTGKPNIGTTLHTVLFKQEQILWNTNAAQLMRCQWRWKPEYGPRATLAEPQRINLSHAHTHAHWFLFQMVLVCNLCRHDFRATLAAQNVDSLTKMPCKTPDFSQVNYYLITHENVSLQIYTLNTRIQCQLSTK